MGRRQTLETRRKISVARKEYERKKRVDRDINEFEAACREHQFKPGKSGNPAARARQLIDELVINPEPLAFRTVVEQAKKEIAETVAAYSQAAMESRAAAEKARAGADEFRASASDAARTAEEAAQRSAAYASARSIEKATSHTYGLSHTAAIQGEEVAKSQTEVATPMAFASLASRRARVRRILATINAPIRAIETRAAIWLWFIWFILYLTTWIDWIDFILRWHN